MKRIVIVVMFVIFNQMVDADSLDSMKGILTTVESFPKKFVGFFKGLGQSLGASPSGYVYSFDIYNDLSEQPVYVAINEIMSLMGGDIPKPHGWTQAVIAPFTHHLVNNQDYYFELFIKSTDRNYSSHMPYLPHDDLMLRQELMALEGQKNSQNLHYFRAFMGKKLVNGAYLHIPKAENLGYLNQNSSDAKTNPGNVMIGSTLSSLTVFNGSTRNFYVGFAPQASLAAMTQKNCSAYALVEANSFGLLTAAAPLSSLSSGTIGVFDEMSGKLIKTYNLPTNIFCSLPSKVSMPYTLEIYQEAEAASIGIELQGLMSGNYDQPIGAVRDITPVTCVLWYQSVAQAGMSGYVDLTFGKVWIVMVEDGMTILTGATPGQALQFNITRPKLGSKLWLYFVYVATNTDTIAQQYLQSFFKESEGKNILQAYYTQGAEQMQLASQPGVTKKSVPQALLVQATQGALSLQGGSIQIEGVTGYLLGADVFCAKGVGAGPMYYLLQPSESNSENVILPTSTVQNLFVSTAGATTAPKGMPAPTTVV